MLRSLTAGTAALLAASPALGQHNYAEALQKSIAFYECQESGNLSLGNRVSWRGPAHTDDGKDVNRDLSGGWYDAGDHWKSNLTMAYSAGLLNWGAVEFPEAYTHTGQWDEYLNGVRHISGYFSRCIVDPNPQGDSLAGYELYIDVGGRPGPNPGVHSVWCAPEVTAGFTVREALKVNAKTPGPDVAYLMSAAMAGAAMVLDAHGTPDDKPRAQELLQQARKLHAFATKHPFREGQPTDVAIDPKGEVRKIEYRDGEVRDNRIWSAMWLHHAELALGEKPAAAKYLREAEGVVEQAAGANAINDVWRQDRDLFQAQVPFPAAMMLLKASKDPKVAGLLTPQIEAHMKMWDLAHKTPGGLQIRDVYDGNLSLKWASGHALLRTMWADHLQETSPAEADRHRAWAKNYIDYMLGSNPNNESYMIGYGDKWANTPHHRGAHGAWAGFDNANPQRPEHLPEARHTLVGGVVGGPDLNDAHKKDVMDHYKNEVILDANAQVQSTLAGLVALDPASHSPIPDDRVVPEPQRNDLLDPLETDRELFVVARVAKQDAGSVTIEAELWNKSAWPARIVERPGFRYYLTPEGGARPSVKVDAENGVQAAARLAQDGGQPYVEVVFPRERIYPNGHDVKEGPRERYRRKVTLTITAPQVDLANDWSAQGLDGSATIRPRMPVYAEGERLEGEAPAN